MPQGPEHHATASIRAGVLSAWEEVQRGHDASLDLYG